ncbi:MAG: acetyl-CoA C-acyltransferase [Rhodoglobus sp.]
MNDAVIVDVIRSGSGKGKPGGGLSAVHPVDLLADVLGQLVARNGLDPALVDDVIGGCVSQVGEQTLNLTRNALLAAGFPESVPGVTIDRQCGSSQQAAAFAAQSIVAGTNDIVIACGVESMSRIPINAAVVGMNPYGQKLKERYPDGLVGQGISAELIVARWGLEREQLDEFSANSHAKAAAAWARGDFANEVVAVGDFATDETIRASTTAEGLAGLPSAFRDPTFEARFPDLRWAITAGNSSPLTDGASAALIMSSEKAKQLGMTPRARIHTLVAVGSDPLYMLTGVLPATEKVLKRSGLGIDDIDVFEVNEAFAPVPLIWLRETGADPAKLNVRGGAIALGHPLGASGTKLLATMLNALEASGGRYGLQVMCEGGGMANATIIERI